MNSRFWLTLGVSLVFLLMLLSGITSFALYQRQPSGVHAVTPTPSITPTPRLKPTPTLIPTLPPPPTPVTVEIKSVDHYYTDIMNQDYPRAYSYFDPAGTIQKQKVSVDVLTTLDQQKSATAGGKVGVYFFESVTISDTSASVIVSVQRGNALFYQVHLVLKKEQQNWKITQADTL